MGKEGEGTAVRTEGTLVNFYYPQFKGESQEKGVKEGQRGGESWRLEV